MTASLKRNVLANGAGQVWRAVMNLVFVPLYIRYLGIEAYGLIGIFALLQAWLAVLDMGMKPALGREMARFTGGAHTAQSIRDLLRSIEWIGTAIAVTIAFSIWAASGWLASDWLKAGNIPVAVVARAFTVMGLVTGLRFVEDIYVSCLAGLQLQIEQNVVTALMATARGLGAVGVLAWISPTVEGFFGWQAIVSLVTVVLFAGLVHRTLPAASRTARMSWAALQGVWHFAAGMMAITCLAVILTQVDKILLSRLLTLKAYGYYALAGLVAGGLSTIAAPITAAFYPRFTELATRGHEAALRIAYHQGAQLVTVFAGAAAIVLITFRDTVMLLWTGDPVLVFHTAQLMAILTLGTLLNALVWIPYQMMLAHGWTSLSVKINTVSVTLLVPAIFWAVPRYGAIGAAWLWVALNVGYVIFTVSLMHRRLLVSEKGVWYGRDVAIPLLVATAASLGCRSLIPAHLGKAGELVALATALGLVTFASALSAPALQSQMSRFCRHAVSSLFRTGLGVPAK